MMERTFRRTTRHRSNLIEVDVRETDECLRVWHACAPGAFRIARPVLHLATRLNRRARLTAWAIALACMVLVGSLSLLDGMSAGVNSVAPRFQAPPYVYLRGQNLLASTIDPSELTGLPGTYATLQVQAANLSVEGVIVPIFVAALELHSRTNTTPAVPVAAGTVALDAGLVQQMQNATGRGNVTTVSLIAFGQTLANLTVAPPPSARPALFPDTWAWVDSALLGSLNPSPGASVQAVITQAPLDPSVAAARGLVYLNTMGAIGFVQGSVSEARAALETLSLVVGALIALLVASMMGLEVRQREAEMRTLRAVGASPRALATLIALRACFLGALGATLGAALGLVVTHAIVSFAPLFGLPSLVALSPPYLGILVAYVTATAASLLGGLLPGRHAAIVSRAVAEAVPS